jgi:hypothetical protein
MRLQTDSRPPVIDGTQVGGADGYSVAQERYRFPITFSEQRQQARH